MFVEEEEWNDDPDAEALTRAVICGTERVDSTNITPKGAGKKSLLRTLQALGSVPTWTNGSIREGSDSDSEEGPSTSKRKKKRNKKRKRARAAGDKGEEMGTQEGEEVDPGAVVPIKKQKKQPKEAKSTTKVKPDHVSDKQNKASHLGEQDDDGNKLSRQQWRNKMKMKKKSKNKFRSHDETAAGAKKADPKPLELDDKTAVGSSVPNRKEKTVLARTLKANIQAQKQDESKAQKRVKPAVGKGESRVSLADTQPGANKKQRKNKKAKLREESPGITESLSKATEPEESEPQTEAKEKGPGLDVQGKLQQSKDKRMLAEKRMLTEKLRRMLHSDGSSSKGRSTEEEEKGKEREEEQKEGKEEDGTGKTKAEGTVLDRSAVLRSKMEQRLEAARFRYINEQLYTSTSREARRIFREDPQASGIYHRGYTAQVQRWPANPVDAIISYIKHKPASLVVADFGCGDCKIARSVKNKVHSFDLAPVCDLVTVCDMANVPLRDATVDIAVFCLSLMGTNLGDFLSEANRVLVMGGVLKIAEVASRFDNLRSFMGSLTGLGFKLVTKDTESSHFYAFEFVKTGDAPESYRKAGLELRPCVYKKR